MKRILLVDDEELSLRALKRVLRRADWEIVDVTSAQAALEALSKQTFEVVCSDWMMPDRSGLELLREIRVRWPMSQRILMTGQTDVNTLTMAISSGDIFRIIFKPVDPEELVRCIAAALDMHEILAKNNLLSETLHARDVLLAQLSGTLEDAVTRRTQQLQKAKREWELTFDAIDRPIAIVDKDRKIKRANAAYARTTGQTDMVQVPKQKCHQVLFGRSEPCPNCPLIKSLEQGESATAEVDLGNGRFFQVQTFPADAEGGDTAVCIYRDITDEKLSHAAAIHTEKMAALGRLAGGVAHEINNPLAAILAFTQIMLAESTRTTQDMEMLKMLESSAQRCKRILDSMLRFSRQPTFKLQATDLEATVKDAVLLFEVMLRTYPRAVLDVSFPALPQVSIDSNQIQQVILNLLQNALQALPEGKGTLKIAAQEAEDMVRLEVADTGTGIKEEHLAKIFDPTFTTKAPGAGTGFGLSIAQSIVASHRGRIEVQSAVGQGTTFYIWLPRADRAAVESDAQKAAGATAPKQSTPSTMRPQ